MHGTWIGYYPDGGIAYKESFDISKRIGYNVYYYRNGLILNKRFYAR
jgi:antitoxin component YwqK of YwqJK toxin-antitoxin module